MIDHLVMSLLLWRLRVSPAMVDRVRILMAPTVKPQSGGGVAEE